MSAVSEIMSDRKVVTIGADSGMTARHAAELMVKNRISSVIVIDNKGQPVGVITEHDLLKKVSTKDIPASRVGIEEIMSSPAITIMAYDSVDTAARVMTKSKIKRLVVLEADNRIAGIVSVTDIVRNLAKVLTDDYKRYRSLRFAIELAE
jgi:CBS domain-containing protein